MEGRYNATVCFICGDSKATSSHDNGGPKRYACPKCGNYTIQGMQSAASIERDDEFFKKAPAIARERCLAGNDGYTLTWNNKKECACIGDIPFLADYPKTFPEKLDRILLNIARKVDFSPLEVWLLPFDDIGLLFLDEPNKNTINQIASFLDESGWVNYHGAGVTGPLVQLTLEGISYALELDKSSDNSHAFLAMWFTNSTLLYREAARQAAEQAGYILNPVDEVHYNDFIMDKVLNLINEARFVIADLTCEPENPVGEKPSCGVRGGVYYEAGYAKGQQKQVVLTCKDEKSARSRIHFDLQQMNTIFWDEKDGKLMVGNQTLVDVLRERIIFTVGKGPLLRK